MPEKERIILAPVPLHKKRLVWRGFNQAELLAEQISKKLKIRIYKDILIRQKNTAPQMEIKDKDERVKNVKDAFEAKKSFSQDEFKNRIFILIDDVSTTGSTLQECAKALKTLKPKEIWAFVIAKG